MMYLVHVQMHTKYIEVARRRHFRSQSRGARPHCGGNGHITVCTHRSALPSPPPAPPIKGCIGKVTPVGFEPTQLALVELESTPLDHSGKVS